MEPCFAFGYSPKSHRHESWQYRDLALAMEEKRNIQFEWEHLDKKNFYVFGVCMTMMVRASVYPFTLIWTRLQVQKGKCLYKGTFDAFVKPPHAEGKLGSTRAFWSTLFTLAMGQCYMMT